MMPVRPPKRNVARNPIDHSIGDWNVSFPRHIVPTQLKNFTPVGTAISMLITAKNGSSTCPVAYMWCAQTVVDSPVMEMRSEERRVGKEGRSREGREDGSEKEVGRAR